MIIDTNANDFGLGRIPAIDHRDRKHLAKVPKRIPSTRTSMSWITSVALDQGNTSQCVAYSWEQYLASSPVQNKFYKDPGSLYREAQLVDEWPGEAPAYDGTSVRAGAKVLQAAGYIKEYSWAFSLDVAVAHLLTKGPLVMGTNWYDAQFYPFQFGKDKATFIRIGGNIAGGHAWVAKGINLKRECWCGRPGAVRMINSWSTNWADGGKAWICLYEFERLIQEYGECCTAAEIRFKPL